MRKSLIATIFSVMLALGYLTVSAPVRADPADCPPGNGPFPGAQKIVPAQPQGYWDIVFEFC